MKNINKKARKISKKSFASFAALWLKFFAIGDIIAAAFMGGCYMLLKSSVTSGNNIVIAINDFFDNTLSEMMTPGETYLGMLSLVFIVTSLVSVLSDKSETIYWLSVMDYKLVNPQYFNLVSISAFLASCVLASTVSFAVFPEYIYVCLVIVVVLLFSLSMKMLSGFFYREKSMEQLKVEFITGNIIDHISSEIVTFFKGFSAGLTSFSEQNIDFIVFNAQNRKELITNWVNLYSRIGQPENVKIRDKVIKSPALNELADLLIKLRLFDYEDVMNTVVLIDNMSDELTSEVDKLVKSVDFKRGETLFECLKDNKHYVEWSNNRKKYIIDKTIYLYKFRLIQSIISSKSVDRDFYMALKPELQVLGIPSDAAKSLDDIINAIASLENDEYKYFKDELSKVDKLHIKRHLFSSVNVISFRESRDALVSMSMNYIDNLEMEKLRENINLFIYTKRIEEEHQILSHISETNPEIFVSFLQKFTSMQFVTLYKDIYEPLIERHIADKSYTNVILRLVDYLYLSEVKRIAQNFDDIVSRRSQSPDYMIPNIFRDELISVNKQLYGALVPVNELVVKVAKSGNYPMLRALMALIDKNELTNSSVPSSIYGNMCPYLGYSKRAKEWRCEYNEGIKIWSMILPEYYSMVQKLMSRALESEDVTAYEYNSIMDCFHHYRRMKYLVLYISTEYDEHGKYVEPEPLDKYIDDNRNKEEVKKILYNMADESIVPGEYYLKSEEIIVTKS